MQKWGGDLKLLSVYVHNNRPAGNFATQHNWTHIHRAALQPDWEGTVMGLGAHPRITGLALTQGYGPQIDPLRSDHYDAWSRWQQRKWRGRGTERTWESLREAFRVWRKEERKREGGWWERVTERSESGVLKWRGTQKKKKKGHQRARSGWKKL